MKINVDLFFLFFLFFLCTCTLCTLMFISAFFFNTLTSIYSYTFEHICFNCSRWTGGTRRTRRQWSTSYQDNPMETEPLTRCGSNFTVRTSKHVCLVCCGVDPCGTTNDMDERWGTVEHCARERDGSIKIGLVWELRKIKYFHFWFLGFKMK